MNLVCRFQYYFVGGLVVWIALLGPWGAAAALGVTPREVDACIDKAVAYIYTQQKNGNWEASPGADQRNPTGMTALATYALISAGQSMQDPRILQAIDYLMKTPTTGTYSLGVRCQIWLAMPKPYKPDVQKVFAQDYELLIKGGHPDGGLKEIPSCFYTYECEPPLPNVDHSNSQYGVLGVWACAQAGIEVPSSYWQKVDSGWRAVQFKTGGWGYSEHTGGEDPPTPPTLPGKPAPDVPGSRASMTAAGIATLFVTQEYLHGMDGIDCPGNISDANIEAGLGWMTRNFEEIFKGDAYNLYCLERIGVASGLKYFGTNDWYKIGSDRVVKGQEPDGALGYNVLRTCFSLLFLARGRAPVVMNKLEYKLNMHGDKPKVANWNERPRDAANISRWIGTQNERLLNWQVVNLSVPAEDLHDAPILYIAGNQTVDFTDEEFAKLRQFVEEGGLIFANADCKSRAFSQGIHKLGQKLFPAYEFRDLPIDSPIYTNEQFMRVKWRAKPRLTALSNGARELIILEDARDPARYWQTQTVGGSEELHQFFDDIYLYAIDKGEHGGLRNKGETFVVEADPAIQATQTIKVARLEYPGNWNPEPAGWKRLGAILHNTQKTDLNVQSVKLGEGKLDASYKVAHLTGTFKFSLPAAARVEINKYVAGGGTLILDSCGGDSQCAASLEKEIAAIFPDAVIPVAPLPLQGCPAFAAGPPMQFADYRTFARKILGGLRTPRVRGIQINGRMAVFVSAEDLSCGLVGMPIDGIYGYDPATATAIMENLVLFACQPAAAVPPKPAAAPPTTGPATKPAA
jgi:hypothetical protein